MGDEAVTSNKEKFNKNSHQFKQSEKINALLKSSGCQFSTLQEMKHAIFEAWDTIKKEELKIQKKNKLIDKNINSLCSFNSTSKCGVPKLYRDAKKNQAHAIQEVLKSKENEMRYSYRSMQKHAPSANVKRQKEMVNKCEKQRSSSDKQQESYTNEEREMIFKSWKKKKDEEIKQQRSLEESLEKQQKLNLLMEQKNKKAEAKLAYSSWITYKASVSQKEKLETLEYLEMEEKANEWKIQRDREALEMYFLWLENKNSQKQSETHMIEKRPPWIPPGNKCVNKRNW